LILGIGLGDTDISCLSNLQQSFHDFSFSMHLSACFSAFLSRQPQALSKIPGISLNKGPLPSLCTALTTSSTGLHARNQVESAAFPISCRYHWPIVSQYSPLHSVLLLLLVISITSQPSPRCKKYLLPNPGIFRGPAHMAEADIFCSSALSPL
jgi:hypothetical protein